MDRHDASRRVCLRVPDPRFATKISAGRRLRCPVSFPAPGGQPDPRGWVLGRLLRWARCPDDGRLHLLPFAEVPRVAAGDHVRALCGQRVPADGLVITRGLSWAPCMACVIGIPIPGPRGTAP
ncbi:MAG: hypothetical protein ACRDRW_04795 [Pseudonocardiaceae bacterium]